MDDESIDDLRAECIALCAKIEEHLKLLRDYATTPGDVWLAKGELTKINGLSGEMDALLAKIKRAGQLS